MATSVASPRGRKALLIRGMWRTRLKVVDESLSAFFFEAIYQTRRAGA